MTRFPFQVQVKSLSESSIVERGFEILDFAVRRISLSIGDNFKMLVTGFYDCIDSGGGYLRPNHW